MPVGDSLAMPRMAATPALREALAGHLTTVRGLPVDAGQVITSGTQAGLDLCARLLGDHGDTVWA